MSEKKHCDVCDTVMTDEVATLQINAGGERHFVIIGAPNIDICKNCIIDAAKKEDRRPTRMEEGTI